MRDTLFLLRLEHGNLGRLLGLIEDQVAAGDAGMQVDHELLRLASEYFTDYPDRCHHPKEDLVYKLMRRSRPDSCAGLGNLIAEHHRLHELAEAFAGAVRRLPEGPQDAESSPRAAILEFTQRYRQHMRDEEERFFRVAEERLSRDDWDSIDFAMFEEDDPLFDHVEEERFSALRERIETLAEQRKARRAIFEVGNALRGLSGIETFNDSMSSSGQPFRLARFAEAGYGLVSDHELLLYIPDCSPEQAAWCAYCYLRGRGWPLVRSRFTTEKPT